MRGKLLYRCVIPGKPVTKKNSSRVIVRRNAPPLVLPSEAYKDWETRAGYYLRGKPPRPISVPCEVVCLFYRATRHIIDLANAENAADDMLVHYGVLSDDNCNVIVSHDGSRVRLDRNNPRVEIEIYEYEGEP